MIRFTRLTAFVPLALVAVLALAACAPAPATPAPAEAPAPAAAAPAEPVAESSDTMADASDAMTETHAADDSMAMTETMSEGEAMTEGEAMSEGEATSESETMSEGEAMTEGEAMGTVELPAWASMPLVDVRTGATFTLADSAGKTIFIEPMATWCSNCRRQLTNVAQVAPQFGDDVHFVALSVETNISAADLAAYADSNDFGYTFAVMTPEFLQAMAEAFGPTVGNPPATPHLIIRPDGSTTELLTGIQSVDELTQFVESNRS